VILLLPVPSTVTVQGVVWPPEHAVVRAEADGFVVEVLARDGQSVEPGTPLVVLAEPARLAEREQLRARMLGLAARQYEAILREPAQARNVLEEIEHTRAELQRVEDRIASSTVRSRAAGRLALAHPGDLPGSFVPKGGTLAHVLVAAPAVVRAAVPEQHATLLRSRDARIEVSLPRRLRQRRLACCARCRPPRACCRAPRSASPAAAATPSIPRTQRARARSSRSSSSTSCSSSGRSSGSASAPGFASTSAPSPSGRSGSAACGSCCSSSSTR
jgi:hypothetical protein